jgi:hypothetical protein
MDLKHTPLLTAELTAEELTDAERGSRLSGQGSTALRHGAAGTGIARGGGMGEGSCGRVATSPQMEGVPHAEHPRQQHARNGWLSPWSAASSHGEPCVRPGCAWCLTLGVTGRRQFGCGESPPLPGPWGAAAARPAARWRAGFAHQGSVPTRLTSTTSDPRCASRSG